jgi:hypothetical protein
MQITKHNMALVFDEWAKRYSENPDSFTGVLDENGSPIEGYGNMCAAFFTQLNEEMKSAELVPVSSVYTEGVDTLGNDNLLKWLQKVKEVYGLVQLHEDNSFGILIISQTYQRGSLLAGLIKEQVDTNNIIIVRSESDPRLIRGRTNMMVIFDQHVDHSHGVEFRSIARLTLITASMKLNVAPDSLIIKIGDDE